MHSSDSYQDIFDLRGERYHAAMRRCPRARRDELALLPDAIDIRAGETLIDAPAGGGYLARALNPGVDYIAVEPVRSFFERCPEGKHRTKVFSGLARIPLPDGCADAVVSLAGLHHEPDLPAVFEELFRLLRPGGRFAMADVARGSPPDTFLNDFVHRHNSAGHRGEFFDESVVGLLSRAGLVSIRLDYCDIGWRFEDENEMLAFVRDLFGIDLADDATLRDAASNILGVRDEGAAGVVMNWQLLMARGTRPA
ncbi:class I SAM-dependent methyltransferase [Wenzhouxiangella sp. EGI_FJ10305]|uniref:class I SAM-dependent methyltransferase n=1 Tax=Wenzhouxiangella sp. EGI_FJ10305 TaxID=3243768 RepID=UPI0035DEB102